VTDVLTRGVRAVGRLRSRQFVRGMLQLRALRAAAACGRRSAASSSFCTAGPVAGAEPALPAAWLLPPDPPRWAAAGLRRAPLSDERFAGLEPPTCWVHAPVPASRYAEDGAAPPPRAARVGDAANLLPHRRRAALNGARGVTLPFGLSSRGVQTAASGARPTRVSQETIDAGAMHAVHTAIGCNIAILVAKLGVYSVSGSSSILAESVHSLADIANQTLLRTGILRSRRSPDEKSNYGYRRELFVWSLISGVGIFCLGAGVSVVHGLHGLVDPTPVEQIWASLAVIGVSIAIESYSLAVAYKALAAGASARNMPLRQYVSSGLDPTSLAVVAEDGGAVLGLALAGGCLLAAGSTGNPVYDACGSIAVGSLLGCIAAWLIQTNRRALVGRPLGRAQLDTLMSALRADPVVADVIDAKSEEIGPGVFRFKVEIEFAGDAIVNRYLSAPSKRDELVAMFAAAAATSDDRAMRAALGEYGRGMVTAVGDEVDRLEVTIMTLEPSIRHVDIETN
jgi:zinc transporter 9